MGVVWKNLPTIRDLRLVRVCEPHVIAGIRYSGIRGGWVSMVTLVGRGNAASEDLGGHVSVRSL